MKKVTFLAAAAAVTALVATPALAQDALQPRSGIHAKAYKSKHMKTSARMQTRDAGYMRTTDRWNDRDDWNNRSTGFWPADVVGGAVGTAGAIAGAAVGTAGAIATAPFGGPAYSNDRYYYGSRYSDAGGYPYGNRHRYGASYASMNAGGWNDPGYVGEYSYNGIAIPASANYDARNGFTCRPGSITRVGNQQAICQ